MDPLRQEKLKGLFQSFLDIAPDKRAAFLDETCRTDQALRNELEAMIAADIPTGEFTEPEPGKGPPPELTEKLSGTRIGRYLLAEMIDSGSMGVIYKAEDTKLKRPVALKFLTSYALEDEEGKIRFLHEAQAAAALDHPNICTVYEIDEQDGQAFIAMAYIKGQSLKERILSGPLNLDDALDIAIQTAEGLEAAHKKGIIHRDVKPGNIMVTDEGQAKIVDFGLAKLSGQTRFTRTGVALGTIAYMSPEQARGEEVDLRTDIWSLGVVLYEMLTGHMPFKGQDIQSVIFTILHEDPSPMADYRPGLPRGLEETVKRALTKNPDERYRQLKDMLVDLRLLREDPESNITIRRPSAVKSYPSIAVLPFKNMSADPDQEYFCEGMAEEIINALSKLEHLRVVSRTSSFAFKGDKIDIREIGEKLSVETIMEGSVLKANSRIRITAQLINIADGYHLWSDRFDREMEDIFAIHDEITMAIVDQLKVKLLSGEKEKLLKPRKVDPEAYQQCLRAYHFWYKETEEGYQNAMKYFHQAIEKDPTYALPYAGIADCYLMPAAWKMIPHIEGFRKAKEAAEKALQLDDTMGEAHTSLAGINWNYDWDFEGADREYKRAIELNPSWAATHSWYGMFLGIMGRYGESISEGNRAVELDPLNHWMGQALAITFFFARQYQRAMEEFLKAREINPYHHTNPFYLALIHQELGNYEEALKEANIFHSLVFKEHMDISYVFGYLYGKSGRAEEARKILKAMYEASGSQGIPSLSWDIALVHIAVGEIDQGFEWLEKAYEEHDHQLVWGHAFPIYDSIRSDPRYVELMKKVGFKSL